MVVKLVIRVDSESMSSKIVFPIDSETEERAALLAGIVQLVSVALTREDKSEAELAQPHFMKSDKGVIGYVQVEGSLYIVDCDTEHEADDVLRAVLDSVNLGEEQIRARIEKLTRRRGSEISNLWG